MTASPNQRHTTYRRHTDAAHRGCKLTPHTRRKLYSPTHTGHWTLEDGHRHTGLWRTATGTLAQAAQPRTKAGDLRTQRAGAAEEEKARVRRSWTHLSACMKARILGSIDQLSFSKSSFK